MAEVSLQVSRLLRSIVVRSLLFGFGCMGCIGSDADEDRVASLGAQLTHSLPRPVLDFEVGGSVAIEGCVFTIGTAREESPLPRYYAWVSRQSAASGEPCRGKTGYQILGTSYAKPSVSIARHPTLAYLVASYTEKSSASGSAAVRAQIRTLDPRTLSTTKSATIAALGSTTFSAGYVWSAVVSLDEAGILTVTGTCTGIIPGETGTGENYTAIYDDWLFGTSTIPTSVMRY
jgi:hypothetical protein